MSISPPTFPTLGIPSSWYCIGTSHELKKSSTVHPLAFMIPAKWMNKLLVKLALGEFINDFEQDVVIWEH